MSHHHHHNHHERHVSKELESLYHAASNAEHKLQKWHDLGHHPSSTELSKVQDDISKVDEHYHEGLFMVDGHLPEGQAILAGLLEKAHSRLREFETCE